MRVQGRLALALTGLLFIAGAAWANITTDYDQNVNFAGYKTYSWATINTSNPLWGQRVKDAVNDELAAKGWSQAPSGGGVVLTATATVDANKVGTLIVDMFDAGTKNRIWRGVASGTLSNNSKKNIQNFHKGVERMFKQFPPGSSKKSPV